MANIKPSGYQVNSSFGGCSEDCGGIRGDVCATEDEACADLKATCEKLVEEALAKASVTYLYGEGTNVRGTSAPIPEPPEGYQVVVVHGADHRGGESEEFYAIPLGTTVKSNERQGVLRLGGCLFTGWWEEDDVVFPSGTMVFRQAGHYYLCDSPKECTRKADQMPECDYMHLAETSGWVLCPRRWNKE